MKDIIVVGGGIGGLCSAIRLLNKGYSVTLFEKESRLGGKVNLREEKGFKFDLTATILMSSDIYTEVFESVGRDYKKYIDLIKLDPIYKVNYYDNTTYSFYSDLILMKKTLDEIDNGLSVKYTQFLCNSLNKYLLTKKYFLNEPMAKPQEILNPIKFKNLIKINPLQNSNRYISKFIKNEKLKDYILFQSMYIGINPYINSNLYTLIPTISHTYGLYYIKGGFYNYILALEKLIYELGGKIYKNTPVDKIVTQNNKIEGILSNDKLYKCDKVICNVDFPFAINNLFNKEVYEGAYNKNNLDKKYYSYSVFIIYLGLSKKYESLGVHNIYINKNLRESLSKIDIGNLPNNPSLYIYYPSSIDNSICDKNKSCLNIMVRVPNISSRKIKWDKNTIQLFRNHIINEIKKINGMIDIEENIEYESYLTPLDLKEKFNSYNGTAFGLSHKLSQSIYFRPPIKSKNIKGLYYIGSSTHPGNGVSIIIEGTKLLSSIIEDSDR